MSGLCKDCRYWSRSDERGTCGLAESRYGQRKVDNSLAHALDVGPRHAFLVTAPNFGCVQFEAVSGVNQ